VRLHVDAAGLWLEIEDHGRGLDPDTAERSLGLVTMRERAELLGGDVTFARPSDGGTLVRLTVPL
jgi:signal transduction histidine kinase